MRTEKTSDAAIDIFPGTALFLPGKNAACWRFCAHENLQSQNVFNNKFIFFFSKHIYGLLELLLDFRFIFMLIWCSNKNGFVWLRLNDGALDMSPTLKPKTLTSLRRHTNVFCKTVFLFNAQNMMQSMMPDLCAYTFFYYRIYKP